METYKRKISYIVLIITLLVMGQLSYAWGDRTPMNRGGGPSMEGGSRGCQTLLYNQLGLDDKQAQALYKLKKENMQSMHTLRHKSQDYRHQLRMALFESSVDEKKVNELIDKIADSTKKRLQNKHRFLAEIKKILKPDQVKKLDLQVIWNERGKGDKGARFKGRKGPRGEKGRFRGKKQMRNHKGKFGSDQ